MRQIICALLLLLVCSVNSDAATITGTISNYESGQPIPFVTVTVEGIDRSMPCNDVGQYRLLLEPGCYRLKFNHVTHYTEWVDVEVADSAIVLNVALRSAIVQVPGITVYSINRNPAQRIILQAIARKQALLSQLHSYRCNAYTRMTALDQKKSDTANIKGIVESQLQCFWKQPNNYKEIIVARQQTSNVRRELNQMNIEQIPNFNMNRIQYHSYSIVSPTAEDALEYYDYLLLDTIIIDDHSVFRIEIEPKNQTDPLVRGTIYIADSTFAVVGIDGYFAEGIYLPFIKYFHYSQKFARFEDKYWMPTEIRLEYDVEISFPVEQCILVNYVAALYDYSFDPTLPAGCFDFALEISEDVDDVDSATWNSNQMIPLTPLEKSSYRRIDSLASIPPPLYKHLGKGALWLLIQSMVNYDLFHFNRVEGTYFGFGHYFFQPISRTDFDIKIGYSFSREYWQHRYGVNYQLPYLPKLLAGIQYRNEFRHCPTILTSPGLNPTLSNLVFKIAPSTITWNEVSESIF